MHDTMTEPVAGRMLRLPEVAALTGTSPSSIYRYMRTRGFPLGAKYGAGQTARRRWPEREVLEWIDAQRVGESA